MKIFVGRQPILDRRLRTYAYELLFRSGTANRFDGDDAVQSTTAVIANTFLSIGADRILGHAKGFINFPRDLLTNETIPVLPHETVVIEVLETVKADVEVVAACRRLKESGFLLALDDFVKQPGYEPLVALADFIKVDFRATPAGECRALAREFRPRGIHMLAEKIENAEEFQEARAAGYGYFQGYFFARPQVISARAIPGTKLNYLRILRELHKPELDFARVENLIRLEVSLAHKLLLYVNSAVFPWRNRIESIRHALVALGENDVRKWVSLAAMPGLVAGKPPELIRTSLTRARLCESIAEHSPHRSRAQDCFLMGLFSLLDAMIGRPLPELLSEVGLSKDVESALTGAAAPGNALARIYNLCLACEAVHFTAVEEHSRALGLSLDTITDINADAISWSETVCQEAGVTH